MQSGEILTVAQLIADIFNQFEAPDYSPEGIAEFMHYIEYSQVLDRMASGTHFELIAKTKNQIVGIIEMGDWSHICLLFVDSNYHR